MNETQNNKKGWLTVLGLIALIAVLTLCVKLIFAGLERVLPAPEPSASVSVPAEGQSWLEGEDPAPAFCPHCGDGLPDSFQWGQFCPYCGKKVE